MNIKNENKPVGATRRMTRQAPVVRAGPRPAAGSASEGRTYSARLPHCDDAALTDPELRRAEPSSKLYRKSWLLNDLIPGFDTEALRVSPSISKGATLSCRFICALGFSLVWPLPQKKR